MNEKRDGKKRRRGHEKDEGQMNEDNYKKQLKIVCSL